MDIKPNPGQQESFLRSPAYFAIYGGGKGGGKTWALLLEVVRHCHVKGFNAVIFRKTYPQIEGSQGLWEKSEELFPLLGAKPNKSLLKWTFPESGATCRFRHMARDSDLLNIQGAGICYIGLDELTHYSWKMVTTLQSCNRSVCGVKPFMRATCNPDANSWVARMVEPWLKPDGYANMAKSGEIKYYVAEDIDSVRWVDKKQGGISTTFIPALIFDNPKLLEKDPDYVRRLQNMPLIERERYLGGNWKIKAEAGTVFKRGWIQAGGLPNIEPGDRLCRYWDLAATTSKNVKNGDFTVGLLLHHKPGLDQYWIRDLIRVRTTPAHTNRLIMQTAKEDGRRVSIRWQQEPGAAGARDSAAIRTMLTGFDAVGENELRDKVSRALPVSYIAEDGRLIMAIAPWNRELLTELELFPNQCRNDDIVDALSGAFNNVSTKRVIGGSLRY